MKTLNQLTISTLFFLFTTTLFAQQGVKIDLDALKYFNSYLTNKSVIDDIKGELIFDKYSNSLNFSSTTLMYENPTTEKDIYFKMNVIFPIPLNEINKIEEIIARQDKTIVIQYKFYLNKKVKRVIETKEKGKWLDKKITYLDTVFFSPAGSIDNKEIPKLQKVIRDVFSNIKIETKIVDY